MRGELLSTATPVTEEVRLTRQEGHVGGRSASQSMKEQKEHERQTKGRGFSRSLFSGKAKVGDSAMAPPLGGGGGSDGDGDGLPPGVCTELVHGLRRPLDLPEDPEQLPQTIVYLCEKSGRRVGFLPLDTAMLLKNSNEQGLLFQPRWVTLRPTTAADAERGKPLPSLLISVAFGVAQRRGSFTPTEPPPPWPPPESEMPRRSLLTPYEVRLHLFQGRKRPRATPTACSMHTFSPPRRRQAAVGDGARQAAALGGAARDLESAVVRDDADHGVAAAAVARTGARAVRLGRRRRRRRPRRAWHRLVVGR